MRLLEKYPVRLIFKFLKSKILIINKFEEFCNLIVLFNNILNMYAFQLKFGKKFKFALII